MNLRNTNYQLILETPKIKSKSHAIVKVISYTEYGVFVANKLVFQSPR